MYLPTYSTLHTRDMDRLSPSPSPHRKLLPDLVQSAPTPSPVTTTSHGMSLPLQKELPPTPIEEEEDERTHQQEGEHQHQHQENGGATEEGEKEEVAEQEHEHDFPEEPIEDGGVIDEYEETPPPVPAKEDPFVQMTSPVRERPDTSHSILTEEIKTPSTARFTDDTTDPPSSSSICGNSSSSSSTSLSRRASVFSLSRVSFSAQLSRLTSLSLPLSSDISSRIRQLPTAGEACNALISAGDQITRWIDTAKKVLRGLDAEDDVEWAAQGRESLNSVDGAVSKFSGLINVYVELIEELRQREDINSVKETLMDILKSMDIVLDGWNEVKEILRGVKDQVETAMEWTELWTMILQDIQAELDACQTIVFEEEEKRHRSLMEDGSLVGGVDLDTLQTIIEDAPNSSQSKVVVKLEDSSLLGLIARMQPLRVSLDFLPMRLQSFQARAEEIFPSACEDLMSRRSTLEKKWTKLNSDVEGLKKELGEDKWVALFRNAGKQTASMIGSVERSLAKLRDAVTVWEESGGRIDEGLVSRMQNYEAKKVHYGSAIDRALGLISKGVRDRITVNGEIIRLETAMRTRWKNLEASMADMEQDLNELQLDSQTLRDSMSTITSLDVRSYNSSGMITPGSSPASSVIMATSPTTLERKRSPISGGRRMSHSTSPGDRSSTSGIPKKSPHSRLLSTGGLSLAPVSTGMVRTTSAPSNQTTPSRDSPRKSSVGSSSSAKKFDGRPRWNTSTNISDGLYGQSYKPISLATPASPKRSTTSTPRSASSQGNHTRIPMPSPLSQSNGSNPVSPSYHHRLTSSITSMGRRAGAGIRKSPSPAPRTGHPPQQQQQPTSTSQLRYQSNRQSQSMANSPKTAQFNYEYQDEEGQQEEPREQKKSSRPASAMASSALGYLRGNRMSMLPRPTTPNGRPTGGGDGIGAHGSAGLSGRNSAAGSTDSRGKRMSMPPVSKGWGYDGRPKWKH
ncbi:hypothetical protein DFP73DRAFT_580679 [Morchella snyderi]|nr:hypothetical protein DFP73DRAFT_580679 [Morchella snyderi]